MIKSREDINRIREAKKPTLKSAEAKTQRLHRQAAECIYSYAAAQAAPHLPQ